MPSRNIRIEQQRLISLVDSNYAYRVSATFGVRGDNAMKLLLRALRELYTYVEDPQDVQSLFVAISVDETASDLESSSSLADSDIAEHIRAGGAIIVTHDRRFLAIDLPTDVAHFSTQYLVYRRSGDREEMIAARETIIVDKPYTNGPSIFAIGAYRQLEDALDDYYHNRARESQCHILSNIWWTPERLLARSRPESKIRDSLAQHLDAVLRDAAEVRREQTVDARKPVDIKITFHFDRRLAIIEIKWLGKSATSTGHVTANYGPARAISGASQLADYLDRNAADFARLPTKGYLVVLDFRRRPGRPSYYRDRDIPYPVDYATIRTDYGKPLRMFIEANVSSA